jgi:glucose/mannose transport system permease protein
MTTAVALRKSAKSGGRYALVILAALIFLAPLAVGLNSSFKTPAEISNTLALPLQPTLQNYVTAWDRLDQGLLNSVIILIPSVFLNVLVGCVAAYPLVQMRLRPSFSRAIYVSLLLGMFVPFQIVQIPVFQLVRWLGLYNTIPALWLVHFMYAVSFSTFFMRNFFATVPRSLFEAAQIDGCGAFGYFFKILIPASLPGIAALAIVQGRSIWNDLLFALTLTNGPKTQPVTLGLYGMVGSLTTDQGPLMAATVLSVIPMMIVFVAFQRTFVRGLLGGSAK